jgi:hypothetical protein
VASSITIHINISSVNEVMYLSQMEVGVMNGVSERERERERERAVTVRLTVLCMDDSICAEFEFLS